MQRRNLTPIVIIAVLAVGLLTYFSLNRSREAVKSPDETASITTVVTPTFETDILINGERVTEGKVDLRPGQYDVVVAHKGFATQTRTVTLKDGENATVAVGLVSNEPSTREFYKLNPEDAKKLEAIVGRQSEASSEAQAEKLPLINRLPKVVPGYYRIDFGRSEKNPNDPTASALIITYHDEVDKQNALNWIRYQGYDPATLEITYQGSE